MHPGPLFYFFGNENMPVYAYGICMAVGIICCFVFLIITMNRKKFNEESTDKILIIGILGAAIGIFSAMLVQSIYDYMANPSAGFKFTSDMTFIGGLIGGVAGFLIIYWVYMFAIAPHVKKGWFSNHMNATLTDALPFIPIGICIAHAFGRLGCFFAGCCYGIETDSWIGMPVAATKPGVNVVPTQLFEMIFLVLLAVAMIILYFKFKFNYNFALYLFAYGVWRFFIEFIRDDYRGGMSGAVLTPSQFWSIVMVILGIGYIFLQKYVFSKYMKHPELKPGQTAEDAAGTATDLNVGIETLVNDTSDSTGYIDKTDKSFENINYAEKSDGKTEDVDSADEINHL